MTPVTHEVNRFLTLLRNKIREQGHGSVERGLAILDQLDDANDHPCAGNVA